MKFACSSESIVDKERPGWHVVATTDASVFLCIWRSEACWQMGQMFE